MFFIRPIVAAGLWILILVTLAACRKEDPQEASTFEQVSGFVIGEDGSKLLATDNGLFRLNEPDATYVPVPGGLPDVPLYDLAFSWTAPVKELWIATATGAYNHSEGSWLTEATSGLQSDQVTRLYFDEHFRSYFAGPGGISIFDNMDWIRYTGKDECYLEFEITDIGASSDGYTYVTTKGGGVERFRAGVDGISGATLFDADWSGLLTNEVYTVFIDDTLQVYGTSLGAAFHYSEYTKWDWLQYTTFDGLVNDTVLAVLCDLSGNWWFGTPQGISRLEGSLWTSHIAGPGGMISNQVKFLALDTDGSVWMASDPGLSRYTGGHWVSFPKNKAP